VKNGKQRHLCCTHGNLSSWSVADLSHSLLVIIPNIYYKYQQCMLQINLNETILSKQIKNGHFKKSLSLI